MHRYSPDILKLAAPYLNEARTAVLSKGDEFADVIAEIREEQEAAASAAAGAGVGGGPVPADDTAVGEGPVPPPADDTAGSSDGGDGKSAAAASKPKSTKKS